MARKERPHGEITPLAHWLIQEMQRRNLTGRQLASAAKLDHNAISRWLAGTTPTIASCNKLADFFGVPEEFVWDLAGHITLSSDQNGRLLRLEKAVEGLPDREIDLLIEMARAMKAQSRAEQ